MRDEIMENSNKPAFPLHPTTYGFNSENGSGLTKREYFAALAMQSMCSFDLGQNNEVAKEYARRSVIMADALIKELSNEA